MTSFPRETEHSSTGKRTIFIVILPFSRRKSNRTNMKNSEEKTSKTIFLKMGFTFQRRKRIIAYNYTIIAKHACSQAQRGGTQCWNCLPKPIFSKRTITATLCRMSRTRSCTGMSITTKRSLRSLSTIGACRSRCRRISGSRIPLSATGSRPFTPTRRSRSRPFTSFCQSSAAPTGSSVRQSFSSIPKRTARPSSAAAT